ncbi:MAG: transcription termination factor NusA [Desulfovibrionaceae bacterium]|nr:transcription termination factor NusA [Desulfovibrionaceae bacterium]
MNFELKKAIDQISKDKGLDREMLVNTLVDAVRTSVLKRFSEEMDVEVNYNDDTGDIDVFQFKIVVDDGEVEDENMQIPLTEARKHDPNVDIDDEVGFRIQIGDLGRIAAQSAKQVIIQRMRDAEQGIIFDEFKDRKGEIVSGIIQRRDKGGWIVNLGRTEAILPRDEQIPREHYKRGDRVQALILDVRREGRGPQVVISRSHRDYMAALFKREVPEVDEGLVKIMGVARDPGSRAKVAVYSKEREVDPVGACVGVRGSRIQNIVQEFRGERIDIVVWSPDIATYARNALAPAFVTRIVIDEDENLLEVIVPDDQLTNAIGRKGQNVKLAAKLLGWKVDIFTASRYQEALFGHGLEQVASIADIPVDNFLKADFSSLDKLKNATDDDLRSKLELDDLKLTELKQAIALILPVVEEQAESILEKDKGKKNRGRGKKNKDDGAKSRFEAKDRDVVEDADLADKADLEAKDEANDGSDLNELSAEVVQIAALLGLETDAFVNAGYLNVKILEKVSDEELEEKLGLSAEAILELHKTLELISSMAKDADENKDSDEVDQAESAEEANQVGDEASELDLENDSQTDEDHAEDDLALAESSLDDSQLIDETKVDDVQASNAGSDGDTVDEQIDSASQATHEHETAAPGEEAK